MNGPIRVTVFPRLDCCIPDFTGKNVALARLLREAKVRLGDQVKIEVVPAGTRPERLTYYMGMVEALEAAGYELPFARSGQEWARLRHELDALRAVLTSGPAVMARLRQISIALFMIPPVIAVNGRAAFVSDVPSLEELSAAVASAEPGRQEDGQ